MATAQTIELEVKVPGTQEEVWRAVASGPGISSWYVPHEVEERQGGVAVASFGPGPEMQIPGRVAVWEPPNRVVFDGGEDAGGLIFEWTVHPQGDRGCLVRLLNTGFDSGPESAAQFDGMNEGWKMFMFNLGLHLENFAGRTATSSLPTTMWAGPPEAAWKRLTADLGIPESPAGGDRISVHADGAPPLAGTVVDTAPTRLALLLDKPCEGTAFIAVEGTGEMVGVSIWSYLYGESAAETVEHDRQLWLDWLNERAEAPG